MNPDQSIKTFVDLQRSIIDEQQLIIRQLQKELYAVYTKLNNIYEGVNK